MTAPQAQVNRLKTYEIHYLEQGELLRFVCQAEDSRHALEQHHNANPNAGRVLGLKPAKKGASK